MTIDYPIKHLETIQAHRMGSQTMVGVNTSKYPVAHGNCFGLVTELGTEYRIVNFSAENFDKLLAVGAIQYLVKIKLLSGHAAIVADPRIPLDWYDQNWCRVCCHISLLPVNQQLSALLDEENAVTHYKDMPDSDLFMVSTDYSKRPVVKLT